MNTIACAACEAAQGAAAEVARQAVYSAAHGAAPVAGVAIRGVVDEVKQNPWWILVGAGVAAMLYLVIRGPKGDEAFEDS